MSARALRLTAAILALWCALVALAVRAPDAAARPVVGMWVGWSHGKRLSFTVERKRGSRRLYMVRPALWCGPGWLDGLDYWEGGLSPDAWPINAAGRLTTTSVNALEDAPFGGRFKTRTATFSFTQVGQCARTGLRVVAHPAPASPVVADGAWSVAFGPHPPGLRSPHMSFDTTGGGSAITTTWAVFGGDTCLFVNPGLHLPVDPDGAFSVDAPGIRVTGRFTSATTVTGSYMLTMPGCDDRSVAFTASLRTRQPPPILADGPGRLLAPGPPRPHQLPIRPLRLRLPPLHAAPAASGGRLVDADGREVVLRGVNINSEIQYWRGTRYATTFPLEPGDPGRMATIGWDAVRVAVSWSRIEPRPGRYDAGYLSEVARVVRRLAAAGIYSVIDMHQDAWSATLAARHGEKCLPPSHPSIGWDGAPAWATHAAGLPRCYVNNREDSPAVVGAWHALLRNLRGTQARYAEMWRHVARFFAAQDGVAGFDVANEPNALPGPDLGVGPAMGDLSRMYARVLRAIRAGERAGDGRRHLVLFEPSVLFSGNEGLGVPHELPRDSDAVYAPHVYTGGFTPGPADRSSYADVAKQAQGLRGAPVIIGEWGADPTRVANGDPYFTDSQDYQDRFRFSALLWTWRESCGDPAHAEAIAAGQVPIVWGEWDVDCRTNQVLGPRTRLIAQLRRGYVRAAPGTLTRMRWTGSPATLSAAGRARRSAGRLIAFVPGPGRPKVTTHGLRRAFLAHAPAGGWYVVASPRGGHWSLTSVGT